MRTLGRMRWHYDKQNVEKKEEPNMKTAKRILALLLALTLACGLLPRPSPPPPPHPPSPMLPSWESVPTPSLTKTSVIMF